MTKKHISLTRVQRPLTAEERRRRDAALPAIDREKDAILARGRKLKQESAAEQVALREAFRMLKAERERQGLSLGDLEQRTGINKPSLSRLENNAEGNTTVLTLCRVAEALGKSITIQLVDR